MIRVRFIVAAVVLLAFGATCWCAAQTVMPEPIATVPGMPPVIDPTNLYSESAPIA